MLPTTSATTPLNNDARLRVLGGKARTHLARSFLQQHQEMRTRDVAAHADDGRKIVVAGRALDQHAKAGIGKARADILDYRMNDLAVAAFDQYVGYYFAQRTALRNGEQVLLALGVGAGDEGRVLEPIRLFENGLCHVDIVVEREHMDHARRRVRDRRQAVRQLGACLGLDRADEAHHDVVEYADLFFGIACCAADEEVGDAREHLDPARVGAGRQSGLEFVDEGKSSHH
jgi:hypothetical protein